MKAPNVLGFLVAVVSLTTVLANPRVLKSFAEIVSFASDGASILIEVDAKQCSHNFPKDLPLYSFTERLQFFRLSGGMLVFNRETPVNGTRLKLTGPAIRLLALSMDPLGQTSIRISDIDPGTGRPLTSGTISCLIGPGLTAIAGSNPGDVLTNFTQVVDALQMGYRVSVSGCLGGCEGGQGSQRHRHMMDDVCIFGEVFDHRFGQDGSVAVSKQFPFLGAGDELTHGYGDLKLNTDDSIDVFYYEFTRNSKTEPTRQHWKCRLGVNVVYYKQS